MGRSQQDRHLTGAPEWGQEVGSRRRREDEAKLHREPADHTRPMVSVQNGTGDPLGNALG